MLGLGEIECEDGDCPFELVEDCTGSFDRGCGIWVDSFGKGEAGDDENFVFEKLVDKHFSVWDVGDCGWRFGVLDEGIKFGVKGYNFSTVKGGENGVYGKNKEFLCGFDLFIVFHFGEEGIENFGVLADGGESKVCGKYKGLLALDFVD